MDSSNYKIGWPLPDEYLIEIGRLSCLWNALETALDFGIRKLSGFNDFNDPVPFILTAHSSFPQRLDVLGTLCELHLPLHPQLDKFKSVISKIKKVQSSRNKYIHNGIAWDPEASCFKLAMASARQTLKASVTEVRVEEIHDVCKEIHLVHLELHELITGKSHPPIWDKDSIYGD